MNRDQRILRAAERLFHERSFDGTGVDAIAREAGIVGSGVYRHFGGKAEILRALMEEAADTLLEQVGAPLADPEADLELLLDAHADFARDRPRLVDIWQREQHNLDLAIAEEFRARQRRYVDRWVATLDACYPGHSRAELTAAVRGVHALLTAVTDRDEDGLPPRELLPRLARGALASLATQVAPVAPVAAND